MILELQYETKYGVLMIYFLVSYLHSIFLYFKDVILFTLLMFLMSIMWSDKQGSAHADPCLERGGQGGVSGTGTCAA